MQPPDTSPFAVVNQTPPLENIDLFQTDPALEQAVRAFGASWAAIELQTFGTLLGRAETFELGFLANRFPPSLRTHDRQGRRCDLVDFHPAYHELMRLGIEAEVHALAWNRVLPGAHVARAAKHYLLTQVEAGVLCPLTMTFAGVPALAHNPALSALWRPRLTSAIYDRSLDWVETKAGCLIGMAMTEKQGGSDLRATLTRAQPSGADDLGAIFRLDGHKWFCSAPMSDAFLTLAQTPAGLTCFFVPRTLPDGSRNPFRLQRLKDKLGNRANASSEVEFHETSAWQVGELGRGIPTILEMVHHTRLDCVIGSAALMRQAFAQALHHARHRSTFGRRLGDQPLMRNVLADLALETMAATWLALRLAAAFDRGKDDPAERAFARVATAIAKFWVCKRGASVVAEAMECLGGNGFVEESILPRLYREMPLNSIWEGSGNVICLDVLRALCRDPACAVALRAELATAQGRHATYDAVIAELEPLLENPAVIQEAQARRVVERLALALEAGLLLRFAPAGVGALFTEHRLAHARGLAFGTLELGGDFEAVLASAWADQ